MHWIRARLLLCLGAIVALGAGCAKDTTRPPITDIQLATVATPGTGGPDNPVALDARVTNSGTTRVWHCEGCGCGSGIDIEVFGPNGDRVELRDPNYPYNPLCPDMFVPLEPRGTLDRRVVFTGTLYVSGHPDYPSPTYPAPTGTYRLVAAFGWQMSGFTNDTGDKFGLNRSTTFVWKP